MVETYYGRTGVWPKRLESHTLTGLSLSYFNTARFCACPKLIWLRLEFLRNPNLNEISPKPVANGPRLIFQHHMWLSLLVFSDLRWELFDLLILMEYIVDHQFSNFLLPTPRKPWGIEMGQRASSVWRGIRRLCGMYKFTTNPSFVWDVNKTEVPCWEIATLFAR